MGWIRLNLVAASVFCFVKALVGKVDEPADLICLVWKDGDTLAHGRSRDFFMFGMVENQVLHGFLYTLGNLMRFAPTGSGQRDYKFFPTPAANKITFFDIFLDGIA